MNRGLLVDFGGVLTSSVVDSFAAFCRAEGIDVEIFRHVVLDAARTPDSVFARIEMGRIEQDEFDRELAAMLSGATGARIEPAGLKQRLFAGLRPEERMVAAVRAARGAGVRTALVSNSWGGAGYPRDDFPTLFDAVVISGEVGVRKPQHDIYMLACERARVRPEGCVFVDDFRINVEGAEAVGMTGVLHRDPAATIARLEELLGLPLG